MLIGPDNSNSSRPSADHNAIGAYESLNTDGIRAFMHNLNAAMEKPDEPVVAREKRVLLLKSQTESSVDQDNSSGNGSAGFSDASIARPVKKHPLRGRRAVTPPTSDDGYHPVHKRDQDRESLVVARETPSESTSGLAEGLRERRINALKKIETDYEFRRSGRGYRMLEPDERQLFEVMKQRIYDNLRGSMPEGPSSLRESNHFRFFEPRIKEEGTSSTMFTMAALRNPQGSSLIYSNDLQFFGRWMPVSQNVGPVYIELYNSLNRITQEQHDPSESWKTGEFDVADLWNDFGGGTANIDVQFNYRILYSPEALKHELRLLDSPEAINKFLNPGIEGSFVFYQLLRAACSATGVPEEDIGTAEYGNPVTIQRLTRSGIDPVQGVSYRVTFNNLNASADFRVLLKAGLTPEEQLKRHQGPEARADYWEARERQGVVHFNLIR